MVRTRSGKATTSEEKKEDSKKIKSPKRTEAAQVPHVSFDGNVIDQPGKTYLKSPTVHSSRNRTFAFPSDATTGNALKTKFKQSPFFFTTSSLGIFILTLTVWACWVHLGGNAFSTKLQFLNLVLVIHIIDIVANFCNEICDGARNTDAAFFFTEAAMNVSETMLFLYSVSSSGSPSFVAVSLVVGAMFPVCWLNVRMRDEDKMWVRLIAYAVLAVAMATNWKSIGEESRLLVYAVLAFNAMIADVFDFPDNCTSYQWCDGMVLLMRSIGCYFLVTFELLRQSNALFTGHETQAMKLMGY